MASLELNAGGTTSEMPESDEIIINNNNNNNNRSADTDNNIMKKKKKKKKKSKAGSSFYMPRFACFGGIRSEPDRKGNFDMEVEERVRQRIPTHLVIMVNGLIGSAQNWKFAAKQFLKKYPDDVVIHCSECNSSVLTFDGVDVMGERLAEEVISVIKRHPGVQKISFVGHSLGGLIVRYAIARLYERDITREPKTCQENGDCRTDISEDECPKEKVKGKVAGLEPINFITIATPHLGSRGHKQVPVFCGLYTLEKVVSHASWFLGKTGRHLFLTDSDNAKPALLLRMAGDSENLKFISALGSFRRRVAYANVRYDHLVGWSTSSLRRRNELPKLKRKTGDEKYPHIINMETARIASPQVEVASEAKVNGNKNIDMEEEMLKGLTRLSWERIDVSFRGSRQRFFAHNTIQVQGSWINSDGADVIQHMIDNFLL